jgi:hypothetical protein
MTEEQTTKHPWANTRGVDAETLVNITRELTALLCGDDGIEVEDSRYFDEFCIDATLYFQERYREEDWTQRGYLDLLLDFCDKVGQALKRRPDWFNLGFCYLSGEETTEELLNRDLTEYTVPYIWERTFCKTIKVKARNQKEAEAIVEQFWQRDELDIDEKAAFTNDEGPYNFEIVVGGIKESRKGEIS